ncbi:hypothetical protein [Alcanivorax sp.]|uniref:hypothetical protein n=1 Tax=Alcanivorax sp. TaxID=1872427 RepID=UPI0025C56204|nr:hypothetical protein [Alcanivorax sp.]
MWKKEPTRPAWPLSRGVHFIIPLRHWSCDEAYDIVYDGDDFANGWLGKRLLGNERINCDAVVICSCSKGIGPTLLPKAEPFLCHRQAHTDRAPAGRKTILRCSWQLREQVSDAITGHAFPHG